MLRAWCFLTHRQNALRLGMSNGDVLASMPLLLARIVLFLLRLIFGTADGSLGPVCEHSPLLEFGKLFNDLFHGPPPGSLGANMDFSHSSIQCCKQDSYPHACFTVCHTTQHPSGNNE